MKKIFFALTLCVATLGMYAATMAVVNGTCGDQLSWSLNSKDSTLVIEGSGAMTSAPWSEYRNYVAYVELPSGISQILADAFTNCPVKQLIVNSPTPPAGGPNSGIYAPNCKLLVPENCEEFYSNALWWEDFASVEEYIPATYVVTLSAYASHGYVSGSGTYTAKTADISASPNYGYHFTYWSDGSKDPQRTIRLTQDTTLIAYFEPNVYTVTVQSADPAKGTVENVSGDYTYGTVITLTANANEGYSVLNWSDGYSYFCKQSVSRSYTVTSNATMTAYFGVQGPKTGTCGSNLTWYLDCSGTLTISGTGDMDNWTGYTEVPWYNKDTKLGTKGFLPIERVIIEEGVTSVGDFAFRNCYTITYISLPKTMNSIGRYAFRDAGITSLTIPANVSTIQENAFYNSYLSEVTCLAVTPPNNTNQYKFFNNSLSITFYVPCGTSQAYSSTNNWRYWTYVEGAYAYSVTGATVLQAPTCRNNGTLIIEASDSDVQFFSQWSDGNTDNPRTVQLTSDEPFNVSAIYTKGIKQVVCAGYEFYYPPKQSTYTITHDRVLGEYYLFVKTHNKPVLSADEYPIMQAGRLYYNYAEKALRYKYSKLNKNAAKIESVEWAYSVNSDKNADTYIKSDILYSDAYDFAWVKYSALTECGDIIADTMLVYAAPASEKPAASQLSTEGKEFWVSSTIVCPPDEGYHHEVPTPYIAISAEKACVVTITGGVNNAVHISQPVSAGSWTEFREGQLDPATWYPIHMYDPNNVSSLAGQTNYYGLHITATENISVYVVLSSLHSMDASNILPVTALGSEYYTQDYWAIAKHFEGVAGLTTILATEDGTVVEITPQGDTYDGHLSGETYTVLLNQGQTYYLVSQKGGRLSGTHIQARKEKKIAVYCGVPLTNIPTGVAARDCLFEQAFPVEYWGTQFIATRSMEKDGNFIGITAAEDGTEVKVDGEKLCTLDRGQTYLLLLQGPANPYARKPGDSPIDQVIMADAIYIETSCPCEIYNYDTGSDFEGRDTQTELMYSMGDPSSVWISPIQQKIERITFSTCYTRKTSDHFLNVVAETATCRQTRLTAMYGANLLDRTNLLEWKQVPGNPAYSYARAKIGDAYTQAYSVFRLENPNGVIAHVYGNGDDESYAYSVGSATIKRAVELNGITFVGEQNEIASRFCLNEPIYFNAQVGTDEIDRVDWIFGDGQKIYNGPMQIAHQYTQAGSYTVKAKLYTHKECPFTLYAPDEMTFQVQVGNADTLRREYSICEGESFIHEGKIYTGASKDTLVYGCDSVEIFEVKLAACQTEVPDTVAVEPTDHTAGFVWPIMPEAVSYTLTIWADAEQTVSLLTLTFNAAGYLVNIEFGSAFYNTSSNSPMRSPAKKQKAQDVTIGTTTLNFTITGLESNHTYYYLLKAYDEAGMLIDAKDGHFTTTGVATAIESTQPSAVSCQKIIRNGQIFILRGEKTYTVQGQEVR